MKISYKYRIYPNDAQKAQLERVFGAPSNGNVGATDVWRTGVPTSPTLATYAANISSQQLNHDRLS